MTPARAWRHVRVFWMTFRFLAQLWWLGRGKFLRGARQARVASQLYTRQASEFVALATQMGGLIIKLGQFMSVRIDLLPKEYIDVLSQLQDALPAVPTPEIVRTIETELDARLDDLFVSFDEVPIAAASLGQVHRATLPDGEWVAVKVLRPGIEDLVTSDLGIVRGILWLLDHLTGFGKRVDIEGLQNDFATTFLDELDYLKEGHSAEAFQADLLLNPHVDVPRVYWALSTKRVLTMEYMNGVRVDDLVTVDAWGIDRHALAVNLAGVFFEMVLQHGRFHADPHPGNVFVRPDGVIQLLDFGMVGSVTPTARLQYTALVTGLVRRDAPGIVHALKDLGFIGPGADTAKLTQLIGPHIDALMGEVTGFYTDRTIVDGMMNSGVKLNVTRTALDDIARFIFAQPILLPGQVTFLGKMLITVVGLCLRLDPELDVLATAIPYVTGGNTRWDAASELMRQGADAAKDVIPTALRLMSLIKRLDDGAFESDLSRLVQTRVDEAERRQTKTLVRVIAIAAAVLAVVLGRRGHKGNDD